MMSHQALEQLQRADLFHPRAFIWIAVDRKVGPTRQFKRTRVHFPSAYRSIPDSILYLICVNANTARMCAACLPLLLAHQLVAKRPAFSSNFPKPPARSCSQPRAMDEDLDATAGLASLASSGLATVPSGKGNPCAALKTAAPPKKKKKKKKKLTFAERAVQSTKRKDRRHAVDARDEAMTVAALTAAAQQEDTNARVAAATSEALLYLGLNPGHHGLVNTVVAAASTGSSEFPRIVLPESPHVSATHSIPGFHVYLQRSRLSGNACRR